MRRDTVDLGCPARSAARLKLPSSTTRANSRRSLGSRFMALSLCRQWNDVIHFNVFRNRFRDNYIGFHRHPIRKLSMNILQINSSARADGSHSTRLAGAVVDRLRAAAADGRPSPSPCATSARRRTRS